MEKYSSEASAGALGVQGTQGSEIVSQWHLLVNVKLLLRMLCCLRTPQIHSSFRASKDIVTQKYKLESLSSRPHADGTWGDVHNPQNISGAWQQNSGAASCYTAEADQGKKHICSKLIISKSPDAQRSQMYVNKCYLQPYLYNGILLCRWAKAYHRISSKSWLLVTWNEHRLLGLGPKSTSYLPSSYLVQFTEIR